jgi:hypothetical protein
LLSHGVEFVTPLPKIKGVFRSFKNKRATARAKDLIDLEFLKDPDKPS